MEPVIVDLDQRPNQALEASERLQALPTAVHTGANEMRRSLLVAAAALALSAGGARAQVPLSTYTDGNGYLNVQKLTCAQLAGTFQEDADLLVAWYSGWYNGLAKKHLANPDRAKRLKNEMLGT